MYNVRKHLQLILEEQNLTIYKMSSSIKTLEKIITQLFTARRKGNTIFTLGNGGSGSTATHFVSDLLKTSIIKKEKRFSAISLVDNIPVISAWANDVSYDDIFVEQLQNHLSKDDVVIAFSGSGKSKNIIKAIKFARKKGAKCIGFTGKSGRSLENICDYCIKVPSTDMLIIESTHLILCHLIISTIRNMGKPLFQYGKL